VIAFGTAVTHEGVYERFALAGIRSVAEPDSLIMVRRNVSLQRAYNEMLAEAAGRDDLEALVFPHQDLRIEDENFVATLRKALRLRSIGLIGAAGAQGVSGLAWWEDSVALGRLGTLLHGQLRSLGLRGELGVIDVDAIDGALIVFSPWAARNLSFDLRFERDFHGYDVDISFQARARGRRAVVADLWTVHDELGKIGPRRGSWIRASLAFDRKWAASLDALPGAPRPRRPNAWQVSSARVQIEQELRAELDRRRRVSA
jgi:hypothetical protein